MSGSGRKDDSPEIRALQDQVETVTNRLERAERGIAVLATENELLRNAVRDAGLEMDGELIPDRDDDTGGVIERIRSSVPRSYSSGHHLDRSDSETEEDGDYYL